MKILKLAKQPIFNHLSNFLIFLSFSSGIFPEKLKTAKVATVSKNVSKLECSNYRPISLLSNANKTIEKHMQKRVMQFLNEYNILYQKRFGFQKKISTTLAIINFTEDTDNKKFDNKKSVCAVFIDLLKAFHTVDHNIERSLYFTNRTELVTINGFYTDLRNICLGVPQGLVLGPFLFLYISMIYTMLQSSPFNFILLIIHVS